MSNIKTDVENMNAFKDYMVKTNEGIENKADNLQKIVKEAYKSHHDLVDAYHDLNGQIKTYNGSRATDFAKLETEPTGTKEAKQSTYKELQEVAHPGNWDTTSTAINQLGVLIPLMQEDNGNLGSDNTKLSGVCETIAANIQKMEKVLNEDKNGLRKEALNAGIIRPKNALATNVKDALNGKGVDGVLEYDQGWDAETHFIFKDGAFLVKSGDDYNGFINGAALATIAAKVDEKDKKLEILKVDENKQENLYQTRIKKKADDIGINLENSGKGSGTADTKKEIKNKTSLYTENDDGDYVYKKYNADTKKLENIIITKDKINTVIETYLRQNKPQVTTQSAYVRQKNSTYPVFTLKRQTVLYDNVQSIDMVDGAVILHTDIMDSFGKSIDYTIDYSNKFKFF